MCGVVRDDKKYPCFISTADIFIITRTMMMATIGTETCDSKEC